MSSDNEDKKLYSLIYKAIVPKGLRPESQEEIEAMLDTIGGEPLPEDKFMRMMRKIKGEEPVGVMPDESDIFLLEEKLTSHERELLAHYRTRGEAIPPEIRQKLDEMRKRALGKQDKDDPANEK